MFQLRCSYLLTCICNRILHCTHNCMYMYYLLWCLRFLCGELSSSEESSELLECLLFLESIIRQTLTWVVICTTGISTVQAGRTPSSQLQFVKQFSLFKHLLCCTRPKLNLGEAFLVKLSLKLSSDSRVSMQPTFSRFEPQPDS